MTVEKPVDSAHVWMINAVDRPVDVYVNHAAEPLITDVKALEVGPQLVIDGKDSKPYGTYTLSVRPKATPDGQVLAAASLEFERGRSFSAVLHHVDGGGYRLAVYENDFTASGDARMTVRHDARPAELDWHIAPKDANAGIPVDKRHGTLGAGQWQVATDVVQNDYRFEALVGGDVVAAHPDLELEHEKDRTVYVVGDPHAATDPGVLRRHVLEQEFEIPAGPSRPNEVTAPADPLWTANENAPIEFTCEPLTLWQAEPASTQVSAVDPDGVVTNLCIGQAASAGDGIVIPDHGVTPAPNVGGRAAAIVNVLDDVSAGEYDVTVVANVGSLGHHATCTLTVTVTPVTVDRLDDQVDYYRELGDIRDGLADRLHASLGRAQQHLDDGRIKRACQDLEEVLAQLGTAKANAITVSAYERLDRGTTALRSNFGCG